MKKKLEFLTPSPLQGEGWGEGVRASLLNGKTFFTQQNMPSLWFSPHLTSPTRGEGLGGLARWLGGFGVADIINRRQNALEISSHLRVPEAQNSPTLGGEELVSSRVLGAVQMLASVQLYNHPAVITDEIGDVVGYGFLAAELEPKAGVGSGATCGRFPSNSHHKFSRRFHWVQQIQPISKKLLWRLKNNA